MESPYATSYVWITITYLIPCPFPRYRYVGLLVTFSVSTESCLASIQDHKIRCQETTEIALSYGGKSTPIFWTFSHGSRRTDGQTDGQTDRLCDRKYRAAPRCAAKNLLADNTIKQYKLLLALRICCVCPWLRPTCTCSRLKLCRLIGSCRVIVKITPARKREQWLCPLSYSYRLCLQRMSRYTSYHVRHPL